ncbi:chemotaxis response regulator protein-glutamate methylesterase [Paralimibaculum aggregatum]|uniref:Protein-glutamate methylesterase/protein-glutamine glutaminase n=1 Tax=Paralimibaculum aggregatum TaxID=3036245 RepID=A0ABQ6LQF5_9RHOB|nr:chemotaxis response regulator protein-glutamate methylesterase [Limibaculum sp. NKW23]GMG83743.1 chemotaxis response regulator protein-glutamate methylesterase [Limibaculum sp. NKW23]
MPQARPIRVLVVDDSAVVRRTMSELIGAAPDLEVMGAANDPFQAAEMLRREVPDVITLDVEMPRMDGITFLRRLMAQRPVPVIVCSSLVGEGTRTMFDALEAGAVEIIRKPAVSTRQFLEESAIRIQDAVRAAARARVSLRRPRAAPPPGDPAPPRGTAMARTTQTVVAIGASTGGTEALRFLLESMPPFCPPIVIVQHMPAGFTRAFAERLDLGTRITVKEAAHGDSVLRGQALIAPGNRHMVLKRSGATYFVQIEDGPLVSRHRPSVDVLFRSVARAAGANAIGVIMTGMGSDGAAGLKEMRGAGAMTLGQNETTCIVYGMPKEAMKAGAVMREAALGELPALLIEHGREKV